MSGIPHHGKIVVYDTEFTSWEGFLEKRFKEAGKYPEIIQIGAVLLDVEDDFCELSAFTTLVKPRVNPNLSQYIIDLTQITQDDIDQHGVTFAEALEAFVQFIPCDANSLVCYGCDGAVLDINKSLNDIFEHTDLPPEIDFNRLLISQGIIQYATFSSQLPKLLGLEFSGAAHNALDDARALACVIRELRRQNRI
jgi:inhibitor of KinA sporulation pathway (predicted exonuclease)